MKNKRTSIQFNDFSGGQLTNSSLVSTDQKGADLRFSPDCLNVYSQGKNLVKRDGISKLNSSAVGTSPNGNGLFNWVVNASQQYLMGFFGSTVQQMTINGTMWSGTFSAVGKSTAGTQFSDAIVSPVTYAGSLIFTTEARNKPQVLTATTTSYINVETGGVGTSPQCKYLQVWKTHLWMLNLSAGGALTEECDDISTWVDNDVNTGASTQTAFQSLSTFRLFGGATAGHNAVRTRTLSSITTSYSVELKTYFDALDSIAHGDYASLDIANGTIRFRSRWSTDGLEVFNGAAWVKVGVGVVATGAWAVWKFLVSAGTATAATVDVYKDNSPIGLQFSCANASTASSGQIDISAIAAGATTRIDWHMDYMYLNAIAPRNYYYTDSGFESWVSASQASYTDNVLPTVPYIQFRLNESASNSTVADTGSLAINANAYAGINTINTSVLSSSGKISNSFSFDSSSSHHIRFASSAITSLSTKTAGSLCYWVYPNNLSGSVFMSGASGTNNGYMQNDISSPSIRVSIANTAGTQQLLVSMGPIAVSSWQHIAWVQDGTEIKGYINGSAQTLVYADSTNKGAWFNTATPTLMGLAIYQNSDGSTFASPYGGRIDDFRYSNNVLSPTEILSIYAEGNGNEGQPITAREGTTFYQGTFAYKVTLNSGYSIVSQSMTSGTAINGIPSYLGAWCNVTNNATYKLRIDDGTSIYDSAVLTGNGTWQYQTLSFTPVSNAGTVKAQMVLTSASTAIFDMASVTPVSAGVTSDLSDRIQRTAVGTYNDFSGTDSGTNDITTPGDVGLTGSAILNDKLYVFKKWSIHRITYTGSTPLLDIKQAKSTVGTASPRSIKNVDVPGKGEVLMFLGTDRNIYVFDGYETLAVSDSIVIDNGISGVFLNNINTQALDKVFAVYHADLGFYEIFMPTGSSIIPDSSIIVDIGSQPFAFWPNSNRNFRAGAISDNGSGDRVVYVQGTTSGRAYLLNDTSADDGSAINGYWTSFKAGSPVILGKIDEIEVQTDSIACSPIFSWRMDWESSYISKTLSSSSYSHNYDPGRLDNLMQFKLADNSTTASFNLWSIAAYERALGGGK